MGADEFSAADDTETQEIIDNLLTAGMLEAEIEVREDGQVILGGDAVVPLQASRELAGVRAVPTHDGVSFRQYLTHNLLSDSVDLICLEEDDAYTGLLDSALDDAITRFNDLGLSFSFMRGTSASCDATITLHTMGGTGGLAGFPSNGMPYTDVYIGTGIPGYGEDAVRHVIMHELMHCVGFRHSDHYDRSISCPSGSSERIDPEGANHVTGTPTTSIYGGSVMNSCYNAGSDGELTGSDLVALDAQYGLGYASGPNSCLGSCGANAGNCWCDDLCEFYGDCCEDRVALCEEGGAVEVPPVNEHFVEGSFCDLYNGQPIVLGSDHDRYVSAPSDGSNLTQVASAGADEQFVVECWSGTKVVLQTSEGRYVEAQGTTAPAGLGQVDSVDPTKTAAQDAVWVPELQASGDWALRSFDDLHVRARPSGASYVVDLYDGSLGSWKLFDVSVPMVVLSTGSGQYAGSGGDITLTYQGADSTTFYQCTIPGGIAVSSTGVCTDVAEGQNLTTASHARFWIENTSGDSFEVDTLQVCDDHDGDTCRGQWLSASTFDDDPAQGDAWFKGATGDVFDLIVVDSPAYGDCHSVEINLSSAERSTICSAAPSL